jgi:hypothetical protein
VAHDVPAEAPQPWPAFPEAVGSDGAFWPELPEREPEPPDDVSVALRAWARARTVEREQLGTRWNA